MRVVVHRDAIPFDTLRADAARLIRTHALDAIRAPKIEAATSAHSTTQRSKEGKRHVGAARGRKDRSMDRRLGEEVGIQRTSFSAPPDGAPRAPAPGGRDAGTRVRRHAARRASSPAPAWEWTAHAAVWRDTGSAPTVTTPPRLPWWTPRPVSAPALRLRNIMASHTKDLTE
jgi:hypothetical protein